MLRNMMNVIHVLMYRKADGKDVYAKFVDPDAALFAYAMIGRQPEMEDLTIITYPSNSLPKAFL